MVVPDLEKLKAQLGVPEQALPHLEEALTHRSYASENQLDYDYQRLEFLGDAVLELVLSESLFRRYPRSDEGEMSKMRSALVREESFARLAREWNLGSYLRLGRGERDSGGADRNSVLADIFEAVIGALFLDCGLEAVKQAVAEPLAKLFPEPLALLRELNPKGTLQELAQERWGAHPTYEILQIRGPGHAQIYEVEVRLRNWVAAGRGEGRRAAESCAARNLLAYLRRNGDER